MSPLEAARRLAATDPFVDNERAGTFCVFCDAPKYHASDCPWLAMPKIVAALEAAERMSRLVPRCHDLDDLRCFSCDAILDDDANPLKGHYDDCPTMALRAAFVREALAKP